MQKQRQLPDSVSIALTPYSARQRFLSASLGLAVSGSLATPYAWAHNVVSVTTQTPPPAAVSTAPVVPQMTHVHAVHNHAAANVSPTSSTAAIQNTTVLHTVTPVTSVQAQGHHSQVTTSTAASGAQVSTNAPVHNHAATSNSASTTAVIFHKQTNANVVGSPAQNDLNLSSAQPLFSAGTIANFTSISIVVGGKTEQVNLNSKLTAAELLATQQVLSGGTQTIHIDKNGVANGGTYNLTATSVAQLDSDLGGTIGALYIPHGVKIDDSVSNLSINGTLTNHGSIIATAAGGQSTETIDASSIVNASGARIVTAGGVTPASLALDATGVLNAGTIASGGNLGINASTLTNTGTISANQTVNIDVPKVTNAGVITSAQSDINFTSPSFLTVNGTGGTFKATAGDINFHPSSYSGSGDITVNGGSFVSKNLNLNGGSGNVNVDIGNATGRVNTVADTAHVIVQSGDLKLGNQNIKGDPTYFNTNGNVTIFGDIQTNGNDLAIVASGNILTGNFINEGIDTSSTTGKGGNVTLVAGANFTSSGSSSGSNDSNTTLTLTNSTNAGNGSATGGFVDLDGLFSASGTAAPLATFTTNSTNGLAGSIEVVAYHGTGANSGSVLFPGPSSDTQLIGASPTQNGDLTVIADGGQNASAPGSILIGNVEARNIQISGATPTLSSPVTIHNGTVSGTFNSTGTSQSFVQFGTLTGANVTIKTGGEVDGGLGTAPAIVVAGASGSSVSGSAGTAGGNGGNVMINAGGGIFVNNIDASGGGGGGGSANSSGVGGNGGKGGSGGTITLIALGDNIQTFGALNVSGGGGGGGAGDASVTTLGGAGGAAGSINISTPFSIIAGGPLLAVNGVAGSSNNGVNGGSGGGAYGGGGGGGSAAASNGANGGGGGGGTYGGGGGGGFTGSVTPTGGGGGSSYMASGGAAGQGDNSQAMAGIVGTGGTGGGAAGGVGGAAPGQSGSNGSGTQGLSATTTGGSGIVNLTFGDVSYSGTPTAQKAITIDAPQVNLTGTSTTASISVTNDNQIGNMAMSASLDPKATLTVSALGGDLSLLNISAGVVNAGTTAGNLMVSGGVNAATSATLSGRTVTTSGIALITAPTLTLQSTAAGADSILANIAANNLTVQATGTNAGAALTETATSANAINILASNVGNSTGAGTFQLTSAQQINLNGAITTNGSVSNNGGEILLSATGSTGGITINSAEIVLGSSGTISLQVGQNQSIVDTAKKVIQAQDITLTGGTLGSTAAPILTKAYDGVDSKQSIISIGNGTANAFITDSGTQVVSLSTQNPMGSPAGQNIVFASQAQTLTVGALFFNNVAINNSAGTVSLDSLLNTSGSIGTGLGTVAITANKNITNSDPVSVNSILGTKVTLVSTTGNIGDSTLESPLSVQTPVISATASKGSVLITDSFNGTTTVSGTSIATGTGNVFSVTNESGGLTTSGNITGFNVTLDADNGVLTLGGNVTGAATGTVNLFGDSGIAQATATTTTSGGTIGVAVSSGNIGNGIALSTAASKELIVQGGTGLSDSTTIKNTGALTLGDSTNRTSGNNLNIAATGAIAVASNIDANGTLTLNAGGNLTLGDAVNTMGINNAGGTTNLVSTGAINLQTAYSVDSVHINYTTGSGVVTIAGTSAGSQSTSLTATGKSTLVVGGGGELSAGQELDLTSAGGGITATPGQALAAALADPNTTSFVIQAAGAFTAPVSSLTGGAGGTVSLTASSVVYNGTGTPTEFTITAGNSATPGTALLNLSGTTAITLASSGTALSKGNIFNTFSVFSAGADSANGGGTDTIMTGGTLTATAGAGASFTQGSNLTLQGAGLSIDGTLDNQNGGTYGRVTLVDSAKSVFTVGGTGANSITGGINGSSVTVQDTTGIKVNGAIVNEGSNNTLALNTAALTFGANGSLNANNGTLQIRNSAGAVSVASTDGSTNTTYVNVGNVDIEAGKGNLTLTDTKLLSLLNSSTTVSDLTLAATGTITIPTTPTALQTLNAITISASSVNFDKAGYYLNAYNGSVGGTISLSTTSALTVGPTSLAINVQAMNDGVNGGTVNLQSSGILTVDASAVNLGVNTVSAAPSLSLTGATLVVKNLPTFTYNNLTLDSNSATVLTLGATTAAQDKNGIQFSAGSSPLFANNNLTIENTGGAIAAGGGLTLVGASLTLNAKSGITGVNSTANLFVDTASLAATSTTGTVNLEVEGPGTTNITKAGTGATSTYNLLTHDTLNLSTIPSLQAGTLNLNTTGIGAYLGTLQTTASTITGANLGNTTSLTINDSATATTTVGNFSSTGTLVINTAGAINVTGALTNITNVSLSAGGTAGSIAFASTGSITSTGNINLTASGTGVISNASGTTPVVQAGTALFLNNGTGAAPTTALRVDAPQINLSSGNFNLQEVATSALETVNVSAPAVTSLAMTSGATSGSSIGTFNLGAVNTTNGSINVTANALTAVNITGNLTTTAGSITVLNSNASGTIAVEPGTVIYGSGTAPGVGQVTLAVGAVPTQSSLSPGALPGNLAVVEEDGGVITFATTANPANTITVNGTGNTVTANGRNVVFSQGTGHIILNGNDQITADPPVGAIAVQAKVPVLNVTSTPAVPNSQPVVGTQPTGTSLVSAGQNNDQYSVNAAEMTSQSTNVKSDAGAMAILPSIKNIASSFSLDSNFTQSGATNGGANDSAGTNALYVPYSGSAGTINASTSSTGISLTAFAARPTTDIESLPAQSIQSIQAVASLPSFASFQSSQSSQSAQTLQAVQSTQSASAAVSGKAATKLSGASKGLTGGVSNTSLLDAGVMLIAPQENQIVQTQYGSIGIAKNSLVLAIAFDHGVAIYNLHDTKRGSVSFNFNNHSITVAPGHHALLTDRDVNCFEQVNPISNIAYRNVSARDLGDGVKAFHAEFDILTMFRGLDPLRQMLNGTDPQARKVAQSALKNAALILQLSGKAAPYEYMNLPALTAMAVGSSPR